MISSVVCIKKPRNYLRGFFCMIIVEAITKGTSTAITGAFVDFPAFDCCVVGCQCFGYHHLAATIFLPTIVLIGGHLLVADLVVRHLATGPLTCHGLFLGGTRLIVSGLLLVAGAAVH